MPKYEYICELCRYEFEAMRPIEERHTASCPCCSGKGEKTIRTVVPFLLKGDGWPGQENKSYSKKRGQ